MENIPGRDLPSGTTEATVLAVGRLSEAIEWVERARGRLYDFHQMIGHADEALRKQGGSRPGPRRMPPTGSRAYRWARQPLRAESHQSSTRVAKKVSHFEG